MYVFFSDVAKVGIKPIKLFIQRMETDQVSHAIIVVQDGLTPSAKQVSHCICAHCYMTAAYYSFLNMAVIGVCIGVLMSVH